MKSSLHMIKKKMLGVAIAGTILVPAFFILAQTPANAPAQDQDVAHETSVQAALQDISTLAGQEVTRVEQARAFCNLEEHMTECAEIGKKHDLFTPEEEKQVDTVLIELKGKIVDDLKKCQDEACLVGVANQLARSLANKSPTVARQLDLTSAKIQEKKVILDTAKEVGVDINACHEMDPDTAPIELLRSCAKLAKHAKIQRYIPEEARRRAEISDTSLDLKEALQKGQYQCGDNTLDGCGNFCLNPTAEARAQGGDAIPQVCRQIAEKFFGKEGVGELESAYSQVRKTEEFYKKKAEAVSFKTQDGRVLTDPASIGRYLEGEMKAGNVEAIEKGMDFMVTRGFVRSEDKEFAVRMAQKIKEQGGFDFDTCERDPRACEKFVPDDDREEFGAMEEVHEIIVGEMRKLGVPDPNLCESNPQYGESCAKAARTALPKIEEIAKRFPPARFIVEDIKQKISFADGGLEARRRVEAEFQSGGDGITIGDKTFRNFSEVDSFCRQNGALCLAETAKQGFIERDYAAERYGRTYEVQFQGPQGPSPFPGGFPGQGPFPGFGPPGFGGQVPGQISGFPGQGQFGPQIVFDKAEALKQFQSWLENPIGAPPIPFGPQGQPFPPGTQPGQFGPGVPYPGQFGPNRGPYPQQPFTAVPFCQNSGPQRPCPAGQYRPESRDERGCFAYGACVPFTRTIRTDVICPALPTVNACPLDQERQVSYQSPECGTYYSCVPRQTFQCQGDQYWNGYTCVRVGEFPTACAENQYWNGAACVRQGDATAPCPSGRTWNGTECVVPSGELTYPLFFLAGYTANNAQEAKSYCESVKDHFAWDRDICPRLGVTVQCSDGRDNDADGKTDYPQDPECYESGDNDEAQGAPAVTIPVFPGGVTYPYRFSNGYVANTYAEARAYCVANPGGSGQGIAGECETKFNVYSQPPPGTQSQCSDGRDNDNDGQIDYPQDSGCYGPGDGDENYGGPGGNQCPTNTSQSSCVSAACVWYTGHYDGTHCDDPAHGQGTPGVTQCSDGIDNDNDGQIDYPADSSCYGRDDTDEIYPTSGGGGATGNCTQELITLLGTGCHSMGNAFFDSQMTKYVFPGTNVVKNCSTNYTQSCTTGGGGTTYPGDANSCPGFSYSRWDTQNRRYCQLNSERKCEYG